MNLKQTVTIFVINLSPKSVAKLKKQVVMLCQLNLHLGRK